MGYQEIISLTLGNGHYKASNIFSSFCSLFVCFSQSKPEAVMYRRCNVENSIKYQVSLESLQELWLTLAK